MMRILGIILCSALGLLALFSLIIWFIACEEIQKDQRRWEEEYRKEKGGV